jgi:hypothetical protein
MVPLEMGKLEYTVQEAAVALGLSTEELRDLVKEHVIKDDADQDLSVITLRPTDLLLLKLLSNQRGCTA